MDEQIRREAEEERGGLRGSRGRGDVYRGQARLFAAVAPRYTTLLFNVSGTGAAALLTKEVRQALAYSLDRKGLVDTVVNGQGIEFNGPYLPDHWAARPDQLTAYTLSLIHISEPTRPY